MPDIALTTDIIVGFPGETTEEFEDTLVALKEVRYDTIFSFIYSRRPGTPAAEMEDVITSEEKKRNFDRMLEIQDVISKEKNLALEGKVLNEAGENIDQLSGEIHGQCFTALHGLVQTLVRGIAAGINGAAEQHLIARPQRGNILAAQGKL